MEKIIKQGAEMLDTNAAHAVAFGTAGGNLMFFEYMALWAQVGSAVYITMMIITKGISIYRDWSKE